MGIDFIPFKLGMEYDNWEFDLESDYETTEYERYLYIKKDMDALLGVPVERIYLSFNADILFMVEYEFTREHFESLKSKLGVILGKGTFRDSGNCIEWRYRDLTLEVCRNCRNYILTYKSC